MRAHSQMKGPNEESMIMAQEYPSDPDPDPDPVAADPDPKQPIPRPIPTLKSGSGLNYL